MRQRCAIRELEAITMVSVRTTMEAQIQLTYVLNSHSGLLGGLAIGLPAVMNYGTPALKAKVMPEVLSGKKVSLVTTGR